MANGKGKKGENLKLFEGHIRILIHYFYGEARCSEDHKQALIELYRREKSEHIKRDMILSLYRILVIECRPHHRESHATIAMKIDNLLTGIKIE